MPSWRVVLVLYEKNIPFTRLKVITKPKETRSAPFSAINPYCKTPTLVDEDGTIMIESLAILQYLESYYPEPSLLPPMKDKQAHIKVLKRTQEAESLRMDYEPVELLYVDRADPSLVIDAYRTLEVLAIWETYAVEHEFIAGPTFTLADCSFYPILAYLIHRGLRTDQLPALRRYYDAMFDPTTLYCRGSSIFLNNARSS